MSDGLKAVLQYNHLPKQARHRYELSLCVLGGADEHTTSGEVVLILLNTIDHRHVQVCGQMEAPASRSQYIVHAQ